MTRVMLVCLDAIGGSMAGPGIRYWELARALSAQHDVVLAAPGTVVQPGDGAFEVVSWEGRRPPAHLVDGAQAVVSQLFNPEVATRAHKHGTRLVLDCYDPMIIEDLAGPTTAGARLPLAHHRRVTAWVNYSLSVADSVICASERQRDLFTGMLLALGRIPPATYAQDPTLTSLVGLVPFGLPAGPPQRAGRGMRERLGLCAEDVVFLWGGGLWNWFDPLTLVEAAVKAADKVPEIKLVFMAGRRPRSREGEGGMGEQTRDLARALDPEGRVVRFFEDWVPYAGRTNFLLDADVGVSTHPDHVETRFSFRTRLLDYVWSGLPVVVSDGDGWADLVREHNLGVVVPPGDVDGLTDALVAMAEDPALRLAGRRGAAELAASLTWEQVSRPLLHMLEPGAPTLTPVSRTVRSDRYLRMRSTQVREIAIRGRLARVETE